MDILKSLFTSIAAGILAGFFMSIVYADGIEYRHGQELRVDCIVPGGVKVDKVYVWLTMLPYRRDYGVTMDGGCEEKHIQIDHLEPGQWYQWMEILDSHGQLGQKTALDPFTVK